MFVGLRDGVRLAFGTLTLIPVTPPTRIDRDVARWAMALGWASVLPVALVAAVAGWGLTSLGVPGMASGLVTVGIMLAGTRFIHADGLADTADGLGSSWDRERALTVMRRGDVGPMGAATLVVVYGLQAATIGSLDAHPWGWVPVAAALAASRGALVLGTRQGVPPARPEGLGQAVSSVVPTAWAVVVWVLLTAGLAGTTLVIGRPWWQGAAAGVGALLAALAMLGWVVKRLGGITGDVLGGLVESAATASLVVLSASF